MVIVAGHLTLDAADRDEHVRASVPSVQKARAARGCEDFAVSADPVDGERVNVFERWASRQDLDAFRASDRDADATPIDFDRIRSFHIQEHLIA